MLILCQAIALSICIFAYHRSHHNNFLQKVMCLYMKACGISSKALDTLNVVGITMNQKWSYTGLNQISDELNKERNARIQTELFNAMHDNMNRDVKVYQARLDNQPTFESGTAGTICIINDPAAVSPDPMAFREKWIQGARNPIRAIDILKLDAAAALRIRQRGTYFVLKALVETPAFKFKTYEHRNDAIFARPPPVYQLPVGPQHRTEQYMLNTAKIDESTTEGNAKVLKEWFKQVCMITHISHSVSLTLHIG